MTKDLLASSFSSSMVKADNFLCCQRPAPSNGFPVFKMIPNVVEQTPYFLAAARFVVPFLEYSLLMNFTY